MFGWEFPPHILGGLGTASYGLTKGMWECGNMDITFVIPKPYGDEDREFAHIIGDRGINFGNNCEILISGSGDGKLDTHSMRETVETENQRFLIHILPKNIFESTNENK